ncbi:protein couch potato [Plakobranchus ocellatus]|uniref:Protein couch potato n=1 Tax=Plakobranchus ocellatus TaxID=259542 RepID=A0AAV4CJE3_9GAST|nr:protein couch potato [Plakobranchus ocellatus]
MPSDIRITKLYIDIRITKLYIDIRITNLHIDIRISKLRIDGYEGSLLKITNKNGKNTSPVGFVTFSSRMAAETAKQDLQGVRFDPDLPQTLRLEFAKSNTKVTKPKQASPQPTAAHPATIIHPITGQELSATYFPGPPEAWATAPTLTPFPDLAPAPAPGAPSQLTHPALITHPHPGTHPGALAQVPLRDTNITGRTSHADKVQSVTPRELKRLRSAAYGRAMSTFESGIDTH